MDYNWSIESPNVDHQNTVGQGRTVDFRHTVIIMTSNLGSHIVQGMAGEKNYGIAIRWIFIIIMGS